MSQIQSVLKLTPVAITTFNLLKLTFGYYKELSHGFNFATN